MPDEPGPAQVIRPVGIPSVELVAKPTINLGALVARVAPVEVVTVVESFTVRVLDDGAGPTTLTAADVQTIVAAVVRAQGRRDWRTDVALVVAILSLIVAWLAYQQDRAEYARPDPPPSPPAIVQQQPDPAEIDRRVDERLREIEQQRQAEHDGEPDASSYVRERHWASTPPVSWNPTGT